MRFEIEKSSKLTEKKLDEALGLKEGVSKNMSIEDIAKKHNVPVEDIKAQVEKGIKVEKEHTKDEKKAKRIALDHLFEIPNYYDKLNKMEKSALKEDKSGERVARQLRNPDPLVQNMAIAFKKGNKRIFDEIESGEKTIEEVVDEVSEQSNFLTKDMWDTVIRTAMFTYVDNEVLKEDRGQLTDTDIFDILGIEEENRNKKEYQKLLPQFRQLAKEHDPENIWMEYDYGIFVKGEIIDSTNDLVVVDNKSLQEDTIKQNGKWVNKGKEGTHGTFKTKKAADAQRKAMFANGYKESLQNNEIDMFFKKAKRLGVTNLRDLKRLLTQEPETANGTDIQKMRRYYKAANPNYKTLKNEDLNSDKKVDKETVKELKIGDVLYDTTNTWTITDKQEVNNNGRTFYTFTFKAEDGRNVYSLPATKIYGMKIKSKQTNEKLIQGKSEETVRKNTETEIKSGKSPKQAYAIAKSIQKKNMKENIEENSYDIEITEEDKNKWVKTQEDEEVWNSLSDDDKKFLILSNDMGFWFDEIQPNEELLDRYNDLCAKFSNSKICNVEESSTIDCNESLSTLEDDLKGLEKLAESLERYMNKNS